MIKETKTQTHLSQSPVKRQYENWMVSKWRPTMAYVYTAICIFDFILGPIMYTVYAGLTQNVLTVWDPLTLQGGGLFHLAMGAVLGLSAYTRGMEKIERTRQGISTLNDSPDFIESDIRESEIDQ